jgi:hypothetical protein
MARWSDALSCYEQAILLEDHSSQEPMFLHPDTGGNGSSVEDEENTVEQVSTSPSPPTFPSPNTRIYTSLPFSF